MTNSHTRHRARARVVFHGLCLGALLISARPARAACSDPFAKPNEVVDFHVRMTRADWNLLRGFSLRGDDCVGMYPDYKAEFRCGDDEPWITMAIRKKRGSDTPPEKPSLKIDFNEDFMGTVPSATGQSWPAQLGKVGYRKLTLNNGHSNAPAATWGPFVLPVLLKEQVALRLLRREIPLSPGSAYAKLYIHFDDTPDPEYKGVFVLVEDIDRSALRRRIGTAFDNGRLTKQTKANCAAEVQFDDTMPNPSLAAFDAWMKADANDFPGTWLAETQKSLDLDWLLRQEAIREILVSDDTILNNTNNRLANPGLGNNYFAFDPLVGAPRQYIPWDLDAAFGHLFNICAPNNYRCAPTMKVLAQCDLPMKPVFSVLGQRTVCHPEIQPRYLATMCQLINGSMSAGEIVKVLDEMDAAVRPVVPLETDAIYGGRDPLNVAMTMSLTYGSEYERIRAWIPERINSVREQLKARGVACPDVCPAGATEKCQSFNCQGQRTCTNGLWTPCVLPTTCTNLSNEPDGGSGPDATGSERDAAGLGQDRGVSPGGSQNPASGESAGCACAVGNHEPPPGSGIVLLAGLFLLLRGRGRRWPEAPRVPRKTRTPS